MKYCYHCNRVTIGEPLFCNFCGRSYNVKLCPRLHANPRNAETCSLCGSRDLSTPQPRVPFWVPVLQFLLSLVPGFVLAVLSIGAVGLLIDQLLHRPDMLLALVPLFIALGVLWWLWAQIPLWFRKAVYKMLTRKRNGDDRHGTR
jgi:RNA polymerase subunit RPABC4/transcription elongation factor Spt4